MKIKTLDYIIDASIVIMIICILVLLSLVAFTTCNKLPSPSPYDINQDGKINSSDSAVVYDVFLECYVATPELITICDVNYDGFVNDKDVSEVIEYVLTHDSSGKPYQTN